MVNRDMVMRDMVRREQLLVTWSKRYFSHALSRHASSRHALSRHAASCHAFLKLDDCPAPYLSLQHTIEIPRQVVKRNNVPDVAQVPRLQVGAEPAPDLAPQRHRRLACT